MNCSFSFSAKATGRPGGASKRGLFSEEEIPESKRPRLYPAPFSGGLKFVEMQKRHQVKMRMNYHMTAMGLKTCGNEMKKRSSGTMTGTRTKTSTSKRATTTTTTTTTMKRRAKDEYEHEGDDDDDDDEEDEDASEDEYEHKGDGDDQDEDANEDEEDEAEHEHEGDEDQDEENVCVVSTRLEIMAA